MLKELVQELSQILTVVENLTNENEELKVKQSTLNSQLLETNESLRIALEDKVVLETEINKLNTTTENLNNIIIEKDNKISELESQVVDPIDLEELKSIVQELKTILSK